MIPRITETNLSANLGHSQPIWIARYRNYRDVNGWKSPSAVEYIRAIDVAVDATWHVFEFNFFLFHGFYDTQVKWKTELDTKVRILYIVSGNTNAAINSDNKLKK